MLGTGRGAGLAAVGLVVALVYLIPLVLFGLLLISIVLTQLW